jgi:hypothetical protein
VSAPRLGIAVAGVAAIVAAAVSAVVAAEGGRHAKDAVRTSERQPCAKTLLADWSDGRIDRNYPIACYRAALRALPADLQVYSSAPADIAHALSKRIVQSAGTRALSR